jgi:hypothetical protein
MKLEAIWILTNLCTTDDIEILNIFVGLVEPDQIIIPY